MQQLLSSNLWPTVRRLSKSAKRVQAALAYVSTGENLCLRSGDTLIVDATERAVRNGETSAKALEQFHKRGVLLRSCPRLHAKTIVIDDKAIVGSGNCSQSSASALIEAAILTNDPRLVSQAKSFIYQLSKASTPIDATTIKRLAKIKVVRAGRAIGRKRESKRISTTGATTWILCVHELADHAFSNEEKLVQKAEAELKDSHPDAEPCWIRFSGSARIREKAQNGDVLIVASASKANSVPYKVEPPCSLLKKQDAGNWTRLYYDPNLSHPLETVEWSKFKRLLKSAGVPARIGKNSMRTIPVSAALELQRIWTRTRRKK